MDELLVSGHKLLWHLDRVRELLERGDTRPIMAEISPSGRCNHRCLFCAYRRRPEKVLEAEVLRRAVLELAVMGVKSILFCGDGEPFLHPALPQALALAAEKGLDLAVSTNGVLIPEQVIPLLAERASWLRFALNGGRPEVYARVHRAPAEDLDRLLANLGRLRQERERRGGRVTLGVQFVLIPENGASLTAAGRLAKEAGADYLAVKGCVPLPWSEYHPPPAYWTSFQDQLAQVQELASPSFQVFVRSETFEQAPEERCYQRCLGLPLLTTIGADGQVYGCLENQQDSAWALGDLHRQGFPEIWQGSRRRRVMDDLGRPRPESCPSFCRHHPANDFLWRLAHPTGHRNFI
jgi:MoaA/NifB/PqqE/SkfB family radical SAM enzyme